MYRPPSGIETILCTGTGTRYLEFVLCTGSAYWYRGSISVHLYSSTGLKLVSKDFHLMML